MATVEQLRALDWADGATDEQIAALVDILGRPPPVDYETFSRNWGGGDVGLNAVIPVPFEARMEERWIGVSSISGASDQPAAVAELREWEHTVKGIVLDPQDSHRMLVMAVGDSAHTDGTVVLVEQDRPDVVLAGSFAEFLTKIRIDEEALRLANEPSVRELNCSSDAEVCAELSRLGGAAVAIRTARLEGSAVTDRAIERLRDSAQLAELRLDGTNVTLEGLTAPPRWSLVTLDLRGSSVRIDRAAAQRLRQTLGRLVEFRVEPRQLTEDARDLFEKEWPGLWVRAKE